MELQRNLLPSHTYSHVSGGAPLDILNLTWKELKQFHSTHYHPSNSLSVHDTLSLSHSLFFSFYTYGDMPLPDHLKLINNFVLSKFSMSSPSTEVPLEPRWTDTVCI